MGKAITRPTSIILDPSAPFKISAHALSDSTIQSRKSLYKSFINFCRRADIKPFPSPDTLCAYIEDESKYISPRTVKGYLGHLSKIFGDSDPSTLEHFASPPVRAVLQGCIKTRSKPVKRAEELTMEDMQKCFDQTGSDFDDLLFLAILSVGFFALHRLGELTVPDNTSKIKYRKIIKRSSISLSKCERLFRYNLPYHKADRNYIGTEVVLVHRPACDFCPVKLLARYVILRDVVVSNNRI